MQNQEIIKAIDEQLEHLRQARSLLTGDNTAEVARRRPGRPKGSVTAKPVESEPSARKVAKRTLSAEGKARIAAAQKARWAAQKKAEKPQKAAGKKAAKSPTGSAKKSAKTSSRVARKSPGTPAGSDNPTTGSEVQS